MEFKQLKTLLLGNFRADSSTNFADVAKATPKAIIDFYGLESLSAREIKAHRPEIMALIEEILDEMLPEKIEERVGDFADIKQYARDEEVIFNIKNKGKRRAYLTIKKGQRGGLYQSARLDNVQMALPTWTETVGVFVTLEEILLGKRSLVELMDNILDGFVEKLYIEVIEALQAAGAAAPAANRASAAGFDAVELDKVIRVVAAYGAPVIMGFHNGVAQIANVSAPAAYGIDAEEIKQRGYVTIYKGTPVVKLPNYIVNEVTNAEWALDESHMFILPANEKPVKVALKGELHIQDYVHQTGSMEQNAHKIIGVGVLLNNHIGLYTDTGEIVE